MKKGKTKKMNFTTLARRTLAGALSLSMIFSANIMTVAADGDTGSAVELGSVVDFSKAGVVISTGNAATIDGTTVTFGTADAVDPYGVKIVNPYAGNTELTAETVGQALQNTGKSLNAFVFRYPANSRDGHEDNTAEKDKFYVAPYETVEAAQKAASEGSVTIVEKLEDLTYATKEAVGQVSATPEAVASFNAADPSTYVTSYESVAMTNNNNSKKNCFEVEYGEGTIWINQDKRLLTGEPKKGSDDSYSAEIVTETYTSLMQNWDPSYTNITIMNLAQITGEGASDAALSFIYPEWKTGISVSAWVKASTKDAAPIFTFCNPEHAYAGRNGKGLITLQTDGSFKYVEGSYNQGVNAVKNGRYEVIFGDGAVPAKNVGQWVYVTVNIKNDGAEVYYNGVKSKVTSAGTKNNSSSIKYFNYGYGIADDTRGTRVKDRLEQSAYAQRFTKYFVGESKIKLASKNAMVAAGLPEITYYDGLEGVDSTNDQGAMIMQYITMDGTDLYVGGGDKECYNGGYAGVQNAAGQGLSVKDITFDSTVKTADEITADYGALTAVKTVSDAAIETKTLTAVAAYDFKLDEEEKAEGVVNLNEDCNEAVYTTDDAGNIVIKLGATTDETPKGVELANPFAKNANITETIADALEKTGLTLDAWTYLYNANTVDDKTDDYYRVTDKTNRVEAGVQYAGSQDSLHDEYNRNQVWEYAAQTEATKAIAATSKASGEATVIVTEEANGVTMTVADVVLANAQADNNSDGGTYANLANLKKAYVNQKSIKTEDIIKWANGDIKDVDTCVEANKLGQSFADRYPQYADDANPADTAAQYSYPYPTWTKGVTLGAWVKVTTDAAANVFEFTDNTATFNFKADGTVIFKANSSGNGAKNTYQAQYTGGTPASNLDQWVYVSLVIKNDNIEVYYDGVKAEKTMKKTQKEASYFNYGTGYATDDTAARITAMVQDNSYQDVLKGFGNSADFSDFSKYTMRNSDGAAGVKDIMTLLASSNTKLYLGGNSAQAPYSDANEGMEIGTLSFYDELSNDAMVKGQYVAAKALRETGEVIDPTPIEPDDPNEGDTSGEGGNTSDESGNTSGEGGNTSDESGNTSGDAAFLAGDADCSGRVDLSDAKLVLKLAVGIDTTVTEQGEKNADFDKSGRVDLKDATYTLKTAVGIEFTLPNK